MDMSYIDISGGNGRPMSFLYGKIKGSDFYSSFTDGHMHHMCADGRDLCTSCAQTAQVTRSQTSEVFVFALETSHACTPSLRWFSKTWHTCACMGYSKMVV